MMYSDIELQIQKQQKAQQELDEQCVTCPECGSQYFEAVNAQKFQLNHQIIVGQDVPEKPGTITYKLLKCVRCGNLIEPKIIHNTRDLVANDYDKFLDTMEGKSDTRPKELQELNKEELTKLRQLLKKVESNEILNKE